MQWEELVLNCNMPNTEDSLGYGIQDEEATIAELPSGVGINWNHHGISCIFNYQFLPELIKKKKKSSVSLFLFKLGTFYWCNMEN